MNLDAISVKVEAGKLHDGSAHNGLRVVEDEIDQKQALVRKLLKFQIFDEFFAKLTKMMTYGRF